MAMVMDLANRKNRQKGNDYFAGNCRLTYYIPR